MSCEHIRPLLSAYLDGELEPAQQAKVVAHLAVCPECARALDDFRTLGQEVRALPDVSVPPGMRAEFGTRLRRRSVFPALGMRPLAKGLSTVMFVAILIALAVGLSSVLQWMRPLDQVAEVVAAYPLDGATDVPLDANLTLTFARPMDRASVEAATHVTPEMQLAFAWQGETLTVIPSANWQPATTYTLTVASTACEVGGASFDEPLVLRFATAEVPLGALNPTGRFGYVWRANLGGPGGALGYATAVEQELWCAAQHFERGLMIWLDELHEDHIYVLAYGTDENSGAWQRYVDTWREGDLESAGLTSPGRQFEEPIRGFGRLWREELGGPDASVGWALGPEYGYVGSMQPFEHGLMLWNPFDDVTYVLWDDFTWTAYPTPR